MRQRGVLRPGTEELDADDGNAEAQAVGEREHAAVAAAGGADGRRGRGEHHRIAGGATRGHEGKGGVGGELVCQVW